MPAGNFHDVTSGNNGSSAGPGLPKSITSVFQGLLLFALATWILIMAWMARHSYYGQLPHFPPPPGGG